MKSDKLPGLHQVVSHRQNVMSFDSLTFISAYVQYLMCLGNLVSTPYLQPNLCIAGGACLRGRVIEGGWRISVGKA